MQTTRYVSETPGINGGYPVIAGTRFPVRSLLEYYELYDGDISKLTDDFPHLTPEGVRGVLDYYAAHPERVDEDIARNRETWEKYSGLPWPD